MNEAIKLQIKARVMLKLSKFGYNFENTSNIMLESDKTDGRLGNPAEPSYLVCLPGNPGENALSIINCKACKNSNHLNISKIDHFKLKKMHDFQYTRSII